MNIDGRRALITGAGGFIGSHLAEELAKRCDLVLVDDFSVGHRNNLESVLGNTNVALFEEDILDTPKMIQAMKGVDIVFHLAVSCLRTSIADPEKSHRINAGGTLSVCQAALKSNVRRVIYVSSSEIYGSAITLPMHEEHPLNPLTVYGAGKLAGELYCSVFSRTYGLEVSIVRPFNAYGPREPCYGKRAEVIPRLYFQRKMNQPLTIFGDGQQTRDFTFVEDTVRGIVEASQCDRLVGDVVNLGTGIETSINEISIKLQHSQETPSKIVHKPSRPGDVRRHCADVSKAKALFGFETKISLDAGLERTVKWFDEYYTAAQLHGQRLGDSNW